MGLNRRMAFARLSQKTSKHVFFKDRPKIALRLDDQTRKKSLVEKEIKVLKFIYTEKATKIDEIFTIDLTVTTYGQIDGEDFVNFCGLLRKRELYK